MRACTVVVIVTAACIAAVAILVMMGWQTTQPDVQRSGRQDGSQEKISDPEAGSSLSEDNIRLLSRSSGQEWQDEAKKDGTTKKGKEDMRLKTKTDERVESGYNLQMTPKNPLYIDLNGSWNISNRNGSISVVGLVPGNVHSALQSAGVIEDPYYRFNDIAYRWISDDSWTYSRSFTLPDPENLSKAARILCQGLDTVANITLNGIIVGRSDNKFVRYVFDVTGILQEGENVITVEFQSAVEYAQKAFDSHPYLVPPSCPPEEYNPECHANFIRKTQCSFSWDWGPAFPTQGVWRNIGIELIDTVAIRSIIPIPFEDENGWNLNMSVNFDLSNHLEAVSGVLTLTLSDLSSRFEILLALARHNSSVKFIFPVGQADQWWPRGYGTSQLYDLQVTFSPTVGQTSAVSTTLKTGFRTIELIQDPIQDGLTFFFRINGVPIFMKGSNWIPMDSFYDRVSYSRLRNLLESAVDVNMNSIRIWGGGVYESDDFYDITDELGILVWQDMMFACSMYPVHDQFLSSVEEEIQYQVERLSRHPSLIAWTANNENEGALVDNWYGTSGPNFSQYKSDYIKLYIDVVRDRILSEDWSRPFLPSSPSNGLVTEQNGWVSESPRPGSPEYGDVHYYNYIDDCLNVTIYPHTRYSSEYGYQSWPSFTTLQEIANLSEDLFYGSQFFYHREHHQNALNGTEQIIRRHFRWPETGDMQKDFQSYIYLTQVVQAICYQAQTEFYRRSRSDPTIGTMGALYWQHNDIWQAPSWSTIDYNGQWKMAHYFAAKFFADPLLSVVEKSNAVIAIYIVNDHLTAIPEVELVLQMRTWSNFTALMEWTYIVNVPTAGAQQVFERPKSDLLSEGECALEDSCFLTAFLRNAGELLTASAAFYFVPWKTSSGMLDPDLQVADVEMLDEIDNTFRVTVTASSVSAFTWLEAVNIPGRFSDNGFLMTEPTVHLDFYASRKDLDAEALRSSITLTNLYGLYITD